MLKNMNFKNEKVLIILILLSVSLIFSLMHPMVFGYGVKFIESEKIGYEIKSGETKIIKVFVKNFIQEKTHVSINVNFEKPENDIFLNIDQKNMGFDAPLVYYQESFFEINVKALDFMSGEQPIKIILDLYGNGNFMDSKILEIYIIN